MISKEIRRINEVSKPDSGASTPTIKTLEPQEIPNKRHSGRRLSKPEPVRTVKEQKNGHRDAVNVQIGKGRHSVTQPNSGCEDCE